MRWHQLVSASIHAIACIYLIYTIRRPQTKPMKQYLTGIFLVLFMSTTYHLSNFFQIPGLTDALRKLDHVFIAIGWCMTMLALHKLYKSYSSNNFDYQDRLYIAAALVCASLKFIFFDELLGWPGFFVFTLFFALSLWTVTQIYRRKLFNLLSPLVLGGLVIFLAGVLERFKALTLWPGVIQHHEVFHVFVLIGFWLIARAFVRIKT